MRRSRYALGLVPAFFAFASLPVYILLIGHPTLPDVLEKWDATAGETASGVPADICP